MTKNANTLSLIQFQKDYKDSYNNKEKKRVKTTPPLYINVIVIHFRNSDKFAGTFAVKSDIYYSKHPIDCTQAWIQFRRKHFVALVVCHLLVMAHIRSSF